MRQNAYRCVGAARGLWFDSRLSRLHRRAPHGCCWCYERRICFHSLARAPSFHPKRSHTHTRSQRSPNTSSPHLEPRHTLTRSSPCSHSYTVRGYKLTKLCSSWLEAGSNHAKGWCVPPFFHSPLFAFSWYTAVLVLVLVEGRGWGRERTGRCRGGTGQRGQRAGDAGMRRRTRARAEQRSEQERSSLRRSSAPFYRARAAKSATVHDKWLFYSYCFFCSCYY